MKTIIICVLFTIALALFVLNVNLCNKLNNCEMNSVSMAQCQKCITDEKELIKIINNKCEIEE